MGWVVSRGEEYEQLGQYLLGQDWYWAHEPGDQNVCQFDSRSDAECVARALRIIGYADAVAVTVETNGS